MQVGFAYSNDGSPSNRTSGKASVNFQQINFTIAAGTAAPIDFLAGASCVELDVAASGPAAVYIISWDSYRNNYDFAVRLHMHQLKAYKTLNAAVFLDLVLHDGMISDNGF